MNYFRVAIALTLTLSQAFASTAFAKAQTITTRDTQELIQNGDFEAIENVQESAPAAERGLWESVTKPQHWNFQKWNKDAPPEYFKVKLDEQEKHNGKYATKVSTLQSNPSTIQGFFKQVYIDVQPDMLYDFSFWLKLENIKGNGLVARIEQLAANNQVIAGATTNISLGNGSRDWEEKQQTFKTTSQTAKVNIIFVHGFNTTGTYWVDDVSLKEAPQSITNIAFNEAELFMNVGKEAALKVNILPETAKNNALLWTSDNEDVATVTNGIITAKKPGDVNIRVASAADPTINASCLIHVVDGDILPEQINILNDDFSLPLGGNRFISYSLYPKNAIDSGVTYTASDNDVLEITAEGLLTAKKVGQSTITVQQKDSNISDSVTVVVEDENIKQDYVQMKKAWQKKIIGDQSLDLDDPDIKSYVERLSQNAKNLLDTMHIEDGRDTLWDRDKGVSTSAHTTTQFSKIRTLALAFGTKGTQYYQDKHLYAVIIDSVNFMSTTGKYNGTYVVNNWWDWQIGAAQAFIDVLMVITDYTPSAQTQKYAEIIAMYVSDPTKQLIVSTGKYINATGANRTDLGLGVLGTAILLANDQKMERIKETIPDTFKVVKQGDGFYEDGSFIQHGAYAYTGGYGNELVKGIGRILLIMHDTEWEITDPSIENVYRAVDKGFLPLMYKGKMMSMVNGRSISRPTGREFITGNATLANLLIIANFAPDQYAQNIRLTAASWIEDAQDHFNFYTHARDLETLMNLKALPREGTHKNGMSVFGSMDRIVQSNKDYTAGISMYSSRIYNYETINNENKRGFHTADGMLYLYNNDLTQFDEGYFPTIDAYRLPGTTIDTKQLPDAAGTKSGIGKKSPADFVGGLTDGEIGIAAMQLDKTADDTGMNVQAKKAYFLLKDKIVALGADINGSTDASIETIIENRMLNEDGSNTLSINGKEVKNETLTLDAGSYAHLAGSVPGSDIGYYFPQQMALAALKETRTGKYSDINSTLTSEDVYTKHYAKMTLNHGKQAEEASYEYVLLPGQNETQTRAYAQNNNLQILENSKNVQAIQEDNVFMATIWSETGAEIANIKTDHAATVLLTSEQGTLHVNIADPTQKTAEIIIEIQGQFAGVQPQSGAIEIIEQLDNSIRLKVNTADAAGATRSITLTNKVVDPIVPEQPETPDAKPEVPEEKPELPEEKPTQPQTPDEIETTHKNILANTGSHIVEQLVLGAIILCTSLFVAYNRKYKKIKE